MYHVIVPEGEIVCDTYDLTDYGVEMSDSDGAFIGFVPYSNMRALLNDEVYSPAREDTSIY